MKQLRIFDKLTTPKDWKAKAASAVEDNKKVYIKRRFLTAAVCVVALITAGIAAVGQLVNSGELIDSGRGSSPETADQNRFIADSSGEFFTAIAVDVNENSVTVYEQGRGLVSVSFTDDCVFYDENNNETDFDRFKTGDTLIVNYDGYRMETYPEMINSCGILQRIASLEEGGYITDLTGDYLSGQVIEVTQDGFVMQSEETDETYTVHINVGYIFDEKNSIITLEQLEAGSQVRVGYNQETSLEDMSDIYSDIIQTADGFGDISQIVSEIESDYTVREMAADESEMIFEAEITDETEKVKLDKTIADYMEAIRSDPEKIAYDFTPQRTFVITRDVNGEKYEYFVYETAENVFFSSEEGDLMVSKSEQSTAALMELFDEKAEEFAQATEESNPLDFNKDGVIDSEDYNLSGMSKTEFVEKMVENGDVGTKSEAEMVIYGEISVICGVFNQQEAKLDVKWSTPNEDTIVSELLENGSAQFDSYDGTVTCLIELNIDREQNSISASVIYRNNTEDYIKFSCGFCGINLYPYQPDLEITVPVPGNGFYFDPYESKTACEFDENYDAGESYLLRISTGIAELDIELAL